MCSVDREFFLPLLNVIKKGYGDQTHLGKGGEISFFNTGLLRGFNGVSCKYLREEFNMQAYLTMSFLSYPLMIS